MAKKLEYFVGKKPNYDTGLKFPAKGRSQDTLPEDLDLIYSIQIDGRGGSENVTSFYDDEAEATWELLSRGAPVPEGMGVRTAVAFAQAIWDDTLRYSGKRDGLRQSLIESLMFEVADTGDTGWDEIQEIAKGAGVDYRMESWLSGVPFEVVITG